MEHLNWTKPTGPTRDAYRREVRIGAELGIGPLRLEVFVPGEIYPQRMLTIRMTVTAQPTALQELHRVATLDVPGARHKTLQCLAKLKYPNAGAIADEVALLLEREQELIGGVLHGRSFSPEVEAQRLERLQREDCEASNRDTDFGKVGPVTRSGLSGTSTSRVARDRRNLSRKRS